MDALAKELPAAKQQLLNFSSPRCFAALLQGALHSLRRHPASGSIHIDAHAK